MTKKQRLSKRIIYCSKNNKPIKKNFYVTYINEKINIMRYLHNLKIHRGITTLYKLILKQEFIWYGIYIDIKNYINNFVICQDIHKKIFKKPKINTIICNYPKERYAMDIIKLIKI